MQTFAPEHVQDTPNEYWQQFKTAKHEIAHALGFTSDSWPLMRNSDGTQRTTSHQLQSYQCANGSPYVSMNIDAPSSNTIAAKTKRGKTVHMVVTERVREVAKTYYECDSITGAELEDKVGSGCLGSHWEERTLFDELMSPLADSHFSGNRVSKFTLALFEDMGWYKANYSMADALQFGKKAGCDFLEKKCVEPSTGVPLDVPKDTFCSTSNEVSCTFDLRGVGYCQISQWSSNLPDYFQYFPSNPGKGGGLSHADYCPMYRVYSNRDCQDSTQNSNGENYRGQLYGSDSFCATSSLFDDGYQFPNTERPNCFKMKCYGNQTIQVTIRRRSGGSDVDSSFNCYSDGQRISGLTNFNGEFICPAYDRVCNNNAVGVSLPQLPDEGDSGEAEEGKEKEPATGNEESHASPLAGGQNAMHKRSVQVSFIFVFILLMSL